ADDDVFDFLGIECRHAIQCALDGEGAEVGGPRGLQRSLGRLAYRGTNRAYDDCFFHPASYGCACLASAAKPCPDTKRIRFEARRTLVAEGLAGFQRESDAFLRFLFATQREKAFAFEVEQVLLADERSGGDAASGKGSRYVVRDLDVVIADVLAFAHEVDAEFERSLHGVSGRGD